MCLQPLALLTGTANDAGPSKNNTLLSAIECQFSLLKMLLEVVQSRLLHLLSQ